MHLTLFIPELLWPEPDDKATFDDLPTPALATLLGKATRTFGPQRESENALLALLGHAGAAAAPYRLLGEGNDLARQGHWLCADPVHLRFHHERIVLADAGAFDLEEVEARALIAALNATFADVGEFHFGTARRWYLRLNNAVDHPVAPLSAVAGRRIDGALPTQAAPLTRWLNEVQMFLHGQPVNETRSQHGHPSINSLWLWGGGPLPTSRQSEFTSLWADNVLARGLALADGTPLHTLPNEFGRVLADGGGAPCVVLDALQAGVFYENSQDWRQALRTLENTWFAPLQKALGRPVDRVTLVAPTIYGELRAEIAGSARWKFWQSPKTPAELARDFTGQSAQPVSESTHDATRHP